ncbi:MAG: hypothetical protein K8R46_11665 [Pirellulales bacterium]|nr:hypothetical protein [Pirellulales bacterium]
MAYPSVDHLQNLLAKKVFHYVKDAKKAAGRALGTLIEIITFYCLKTWGFEHNTAIERRLPEYANDDITHNVEFSLHPSVSSVTLPFSRSSLPLTPHKIARNPSLAAFALADCELRSSTFLTKNLILRNACTVCDLGDRFINVYLGNLSGEEGQFIVVSLRRRPFAIVECKRVGVEEGMRKGPQTIEKAKQGAYVARSVSSLQKIRFADGRMGGMIETRDGTFRCEEYVSLLDEIIASDDAELLSRFVLTIGVVSNHGNWFTSRDHNKELKVLAQSYDWLLFLTDAGLAQFIDEVLLHPDGDLAAARDAFLTSYTGKKGANRFTKVKVALAADAALQSYFTNRLKVIEGWFNIIAPATRLLPSLRDELNTLKSKNWEDIHP